MKKIFTYLFLSVLTLHIASAQTDTEIVAGNGSGFPWAFPIEYWFIGDTLLPVEPYTRIEAKADTIENFDPETCDFDLEWNKITTPSYVINKVSGNPLSATGPDDLKNASWKALYDADYIYLLIQYEDDNITGDEGIELCISPYFKLDVKDTVQAIVKTVLKDAPGVWYTRYSQFGAFKATFKNYGLEGTMSVSFSQWGQGTINYYDFNEAYTNNLFLFDHSPIGSNTIKQIITVGYGALKNTIRNVDMDVPLWKTLNDGKGFSFDLKINDSDIDDVAMAGSDGLIMKPATYWWNAESDKCWMSTVYAGFLGVRPDPSGVISNKTLSNESIFGTKTKDYVALLKSADSRIYNTIGKLVLSYKNTDRIDLSSLGSGVYIIHVNNETVKVVR